MNPSPRTIKWGLSGFGPRHALYLIHQAMVILAHRDELARIKNHGIDFILHYTVFEKQDTAGVGNAFQIDCDAAVNTPVTMPPDILGNKVDPEFMAFADLPSTVSRKVMAEYDVILADLKKRNPPVAVLFKKALQPDGTFDTSGACMTRGMWGRIQLENIRKALDYIHSNIPEIVIEINYLHEVVDVDFSDRRRPVLVVRKVGEDDKYRYPFDFVSFAHGTPLVSPLKPEVVSKAYSLTPNHETMRDYLRRCNVLDADDRIIPGKSIACTGLSLSFYDYATLLLAFMPGSQLSDDPAGFTLQEPHATNYQGLITVISRSSRGPAPPRTAPDSKWRGGGRVFFSARDVHALRLQRNANWLPIAYEFLEAHVARSMSKVPSQVNSHESIADYMASYHDDNNMYLTGGGVTETDLLRAGYVAFSMGTGLLVGPDAGEEDDLIHVAKFTRNGRVGIPMFTASGFEISSMSNYDTEANTKFFSRWDELQLFNAASPVVIQNSIATMFTSGIATHVKGTFDQIDISPKGKVTFNGREFDALLAPKVMRREGDPVLHATKGFVKEIFDGVPDYGKGGYFQTIDGKPINAFDAGMGGWGTKVPSNNGSLRTVGAQWNGLTNSHLAAAGFATNHAYHTLTLAIALCLDPNQSPIETVTGIYNEILPDPEKFNEEVNGFEADWKDLQERLHFLRLATRLAGNDVTLYHEITNNIFSKEARDNFLDQLGQDARQPELVKEYDPPTRKQYEQRFADYTKPQYREMLKAIFRRVGAMPQQGSMPVPISERIVAFAEAISKDIVAFAKSISKGTTLGFAIPVPNFICFSTRDQNLHRSH